MANTTVPFYGIEGPANVGAQVRIRVRNPDGTINSEFPVPEEVNGSSAGIGVFSTSANLALTDAISGLPYTWEARQVTTQTSVAFDAATDSAILVPKQAMGWVRNGSLFQDANLDALLNGVFYMNTGGAGGTVVVSGAPVSLYINWNDFVNAFGLQNIIKVSNKDTTMQSPTGAQPIPSGTPNWYAVQMAFNFATDKIHSVLYGGILKVPLDFTNNNNVVPDRVSRWAMTIAYCDLLGMRTPDKVPPTRARGGGTSPLAAYYSQLDEVLTDIAMHKHGQFRQMPEAVHVIDSSPVVVQRQDVVGGAVRYIDGSWQFGWIQQIL
jgi:hypothetical protein